MKPYQKSLIGSRQKSKERQYVTELGGSDDAQHASSIAGPELLLHARANPRLDYIGREEELSLSENLLKHYIGIYDPLTAELQLIQARTVAIRSAPQSDVASRTENEVERSLHSVCSSCFHTITGPRGLQRIELIEIH